MIQVMIELDIKTHIGCRKKIRDCLPVIDKNIYKRGKTI